MFDDLKESWFVSQVETVIQTEINGLPDLLKSLSKDLAHAIVIKQYQVRSFVFSKVDGVRLDPRIAALESVLTFVSIYGVQGEILVHGQDCLGSLKIVCIKLLQQLEAEPLPVTEKTYIETFISPLIQNVLIDRGHS
ncbi:hypothetical protein HZM05_002905 [Salmonella enterica]|nr:hypothetical protein [Salmonella enterica]EIV1877169.1 hypothetical protein [Salmonella enterica]